MPQEMVILVGLPASGKSTYAKGWLEAHPEGAYRCNYDDLRLEMFEPDWKFNRADEQRMKKEAIRRAKDALMVGESVIIDNTNLTPRARETWINIAKGFGLEAEIYEMPTSLEECLHRDARREGKARVGRAVIERMALFNGLIDWASPAYAGRPFILVDMDGTLADCTERRLKAFKDGEECPAHDRRYDRGCEMCERARPRKDWPTFFRKVEDDPPFPHIVNLVNILSAHYHLIVVSGRPIDRCGKGTEAWLEKHYIHPRHLFMRDSGDSRADDIVKQEILDRLPKERIAFVLDDRDQVVSMWRRNGVPCLQVAEGAF